MSAATADIPAGEATAHGRTLTRLLAEYERKLTEIRREAVRVRSAFARGGDLDPAGRDLDAVRTLLGTVEPAATLLVSQASQWLDHAAPRGSAEETELAVRLAEFEPLLRAARLAVRDAVRDADRVR